MGRLADGDMGYRNFNAFVGPNSSFMSGTFVNNNHWMVDLVDVSQNRLSGGTMLSPNRAFQFENGKLVVEVDAAAGQDGMGGADHFYEVDITPAAAPTDFVVDALYGYGMFGGAGAVGCRLERGNNICTMYDDSNRVTGGECPNDGRVCRNNGGRPGRVWETQGVGTARTAPSVEGGEPGYAIPGTNLHGRDVFRICNDNQNDRFCRDRFRFEITKTTLTIFVNGYKWFDIQGLYAVNPETGADNRIPDSWLGPAGVHVYLTSWINGGQHTPTRWHWGRIAVNPHAANGSILPPSAAPTFCLGEVQNTCPADMPMH